mmetsp:Transcript_1725/g.2285  ORF Transcript_1725/g.2285 Transcript_1725/m.2285 type:complete len:335 (+) Transcript_1725:186-1190(+)|eukprot:CAMPEP_0197295814 /NCGR_PEP_ID=MMETSP0890-20130614/36587_1 /TAXON_ID=44058 ORGANISM="Aureoumbra lagunensis, Strain CCMP1510" /NCGR_SAMPLE_ID=MMETSP0890 /ASSEMBLY_ACC=CAM_ASM_000533 /LENGTH=334 /DNA_ID=CAMNT_0042772019 /DNA_START=170 /DNA_END=1174 /DNA_ORIENTATION=+
MGAQLSNYADMKNSVCATSDDVIDLDKEGEANEEKKEVEKTYSQKFSDALFYWDLIPLPRKLEEESIMYGSTVLGGSCSVLRPESKLKEKLFNWPDSNFSNENCVLAKFGFEPYKQMEAGDAAIEFNLVKISSSLKLENFDTIKNNRQRLSDLLKKGRPVLLCAVATSCPACMAFSSEMESFARDYPQILCVGITVMQPHPEAPEKSFENGTIWEMSYSRGVSQPRTLEGRIEIAQIIQRKLPSWLILADDLPSIHEEEEDAIRREKETKINPFWSTYGPAPRCAYLLDDSGLIVHSQLWWNSDRTRKAADAYLVATGHAALTNGNVDDENEDK